MKHLLVALLGLCMTIGAFAQTPDLGGWYMYFGMNRFHDQFSVHTEAQYRNHDITPSIEQLLLRTGLNWHATDNAMLTAGYAHITSHVYDSEQSAPEVTEHRIWQQLILKQKVSRLMFEHRYRVEQRWSNDVYSNRLRYRVFVALPLNKPSLEKGAVFLSAYDEVFINTRQIYFDRNRLYGAVGYVPQKGTNVQVGMMNQAVNFSDKWYLQLALTYNPDFRKEQD